MSRDNLRKLKLTHFFRSSNQQKIMKKNNNIQNNIQSENIINGSQHIQLGGTATYNNSNTFFFAPDNNVRGRVDSFRRRGIAQQLTDGTFDFVALPKPKSMSTLIRKLPHGRVSRTADGAIQLTLKVYCDEGVNIGEALADEAAEASEAVVDYQLKR